VEHSLQDAPLLARNSYEKWAAEAKSRNVTGRPIPQAPRGDRYKWLNDWML